MEIAAYTLTILFSYLLGSIPTGFLVAKAKGIDIRAVGSGNIGATNVFRVLGKSAGFFVLAADALKGSLACLLIPFLVLQIFPGAPIKSAQENLALVAGLSAILGHNFTCWLRFKGGKGIATSAGVILALTPAAGVSALVIWGVVLAATKYVSLASIAASASLPFASLFWHDSPMVVYFYAGMAALAIFKHKANIQRLLNGTESRIGANKNVKEPTT